MKKILLILIGMTAGAALVHAQGGIILWNDLSAGQTTNTTEYQIGYPSVVGGISGKTSTWNSGNHFYFALLAATTTNAADEGNPAGPDWSVVLNTANSLATQGTNGVAAGSVAGDGGAGGVASSLNANQTYYMMVVGWSADIGTSWSQVSAYFADDFVTYGGFGYAGYSNIGTITPGTSVPGPIFGGSGVVVGGLVLYYTFVPEPTTLALAGLGGLSMLFLRRRK